MFDNKKLIGILLSALAIISLIAYSVSNGAGNVITGAVNNTGAWIGRIFSEPVNVVVQFADSIDNLINTFDENQTLKKDIDQINELQVRVADLETENEKMRQELDLKEVLSNYRSVNATVISRNPDQWVETMMINVGANQGIEKDMAVMAGNGLIGRIIEVNQNSAKVLLLTSQQSKEGMVAARIQTKDNSSSANGIISGYDPKTGNYIMTQVDPEAKVEAGDMVITSGLGGVIPSTLLIGEVVEAKMDAYGLFQEITVEPAGEMTDIRFVTVIVKQEGAIVDNAINGQADSQESQPEGEAPSDESRSADESTAVEESSAEDGTNDTPEGQSGD